MSDIGAEYEAQLAMYESMERDAMIETIKELEKDRDALLNVCRIALQQFDFMAGQRKRGWDIQFLRERLSGTIQEVEGSAPQELVM